ncbi:two-component system response regulator [Niastella koreensis]|uniref:Two component transcriptional regulator, winged helix family n=2 Tax=Niastella koreensis TaxID=354356 RepID=G8T8H8_NIAKG|nr:response regulator transcription factor [Niastella koreensis]AEW00150.1 two component transcriptional regulator, winged helix family [Niastella koreensis GR20-10]OQP49543.1 two-component system response regulator [Niastella koreensis]
MENIKVLLVEDEEILASIIKESLEKRGFIVTIAKNGVEGWQLFRTVRPDICVVDVMMPRKDGFTLTTEIRAADDDTPIIMLTARTQTEDVLKGFESGADDYMKKPFSMEELIFRLKALVRRTVGKPAETVEKNMPIGQFLFRYQYLELVFGSAISPLSQREADLLLLLVQHKNQLLDRKLALIKLWGEENPFTARSMDVYVTRLRKLFRPDPSIEIINTRGHGYSLIEKNR